MVWGGDTFLENNHYWQYNMMTKSKQKPLTTGCISSELNECA